VAGFVADAERDEFAVGREPGADCIARAGGCLFGRKELSLARVADSVVGELRYGEGAARGGFERYQRRRLFEGPRRRIF
jgi:hypothetical protein